MGKWTISNNAKVDKIINSHIELIVKRIVATFNPVSIIVSGSFGKGEGSVYLRDDDKLIYLSDYEIIIVQDKPILKSKLKELSKSLSKSISADVELYHNFTFKYTLPFLKRFFYRENFLQLNVYERRYSCKVIYGEDLITKLPQVSSKNIPLWEGIRLILNRITHSLEYISYNDIFSRTNGEKIYWLYKSILSCSDALLICSKDYHHSYQKRCQIFQEIFPMKFPQLYKDIPDLIELVQEATEYKLNPYTHQTRDINLLWFKVVDICDMVFRFLIKEELGFSFNSYIEFQEKYLESSKVRRRFYRYLCAGFQNIMNIIVLVKMHGVKFLFQKDIFRTYYHQELYSLIAIFYFSTLSDNASLNKRNLDFVNSRISKTFLYAQNYADNDIRYYEDIRVTLVKLWEKLYK